jgi:hypothetical protein
VAVQGSLTIDLHAAIISGSNALGTLTHLVTVFMNVKAQAEPSFEALLSEKYINQLFTRFARLPFYSQTDVIPDPFAEEYIWQHPLSAETLAMVQKGFLTRCRDPIGTRIRTDAVKHIEENFQGRVKESTSCVIWREECGLAALISILKRCCDWQHILYSKLQW